MAENKTLLSSCFGSKNNHIFACKKLMKIIIAFLESIKQIKSSVFILFHSNSTSKYELIYFVISAKRKIMPSLNFVTDIVEGVIQRILRELLGLSGGILSSECHCSIEKIYSVKIQRGPDSTKFLK